MGKLNPPVSVKDHQTGNTKAIVTLLEYGDYQCPYCGHVHPLVKRLLKEKGDDLRFVFRTFNYSNVKGLIVFKLYPDFSISPECLNGLVKSIENKYPGKKIK